MSSSCSVYWRIQEREEEYQERDEEEDDNNINKYDDNDDIIASDDERFGELTKKVLKSPTSKQYHRTRTSTRTSTRTLSLSSADGIVNCDNYFVTSNNENIKNNNNDTKCTITIPSTTTTTTMMRRLNFLLFGMLLSTCVMTTVFLSLSSSSFPFPVPLLLTKKISLKKYQRTILAGVKKITQQQHQQHGRNKNSSRINNFFSREGNYNRTYDYSSSSLLSLDQHRQFNKKRHKKRFLEENFTTDDNNTSSGGGGDDDDGHFGDLPTVTIMIEPGVDSSNITNGAIVNTEENTTDSNVTIADNNNTMVSVNSTTTNDDNQIITVSTDNNDNNTGTGNTTTTSNNNANNSDATTVNKNNDALNITNSTFLPTIFDPTGSPTGSPTIQPNNSSNNNNNTNSTDLPTIFDDTEMPTVIDPPTGLPSSPPSMTPTDSLPPTISFAPTNYPTVTKVPSNEPSPTPTTTPTATPGPSISMLPSPPPSPPPTTLPPSWSPSGSPSVSSSPTEIPSDSPTQVPTLSFMPSVAPTISVEPSSSPPNEMISMNSTENIVETDIVMIISNVPTQNFTSEQIKIWENVTSFHLYQYYEILQQTFPNDVPFTIVDAKDVETTFQKLTIEGVSLADALEDDGTAEEDDDLNSSERSSDSDDVLVFDNNEFNQEQQQQDQEQNQVQKQEKPLAHNFAPPILAAIAAKQETVTMSITFTQNVTYLMSNETYFSGLSNKEIMDGFFVIPFETDSFTYSINLVDAMNWSTFILVDYVLPGQTETPAPAPTMAPTAGKELDDMSVIVISVSIVFAACIIVLFLLWDRKHKVEPNAMMYADRRGELSFTSSIGAQQLPLPLSNEQRQQGGGDDTSASTEYDMPGLPMKYNYSLNQPDFNDAGEGAINNNTDERNLASSTRSAPPMSMLRTLSDIRQQVSGESRLYASPNTPGNNRQNINSNHKSVITGTSSRSSSSSGGGRTSSSTSSKNSVRHGLPPLPPPLPVQHPASSYSPHTHFEHVNVVGEDNGNNPPLSANFHRPSRPGFAMRMSSITNSSITDISFMSDAFPSDREFTSEDFNPPEFPPPRPNNQYQHHNHFENLEQQSEAFSSPLHLPYEDSTPDIRVLLDHHSHHTPPESPTIPAILDMTSTSSLPLPPTENTTLTPVVMAGFDMKIQDIE